MQLTRFLPRRRQWQQLLYTLALRDICHIFVDTKFLNWELRVRLFLTLSLQSMASQLNESPDSLQQKNIVKGVPTLFFDFIIYLEHAAANQTKWTFVMRAKIAGMAKKLASFVIQPIHGYSPVRNGQTSKGKQTNQNYRHNAGHEIKIYFGSFSA